MTATYMRVCVCVALVAEERVRQLQMRVHSNRVSAANPSSQQDLDRALKNKRDVRNLLFLFLNYFSCQIEKQLNQVCVFVCMCSPQLYKDQRRRSSENVSHKSSDSDVSDVSAISRTSSASRISSTSYMSIQSERPRGRFR